MKLLYIALFVLSTALAWAQVNPPANVVARFNTEYPEHQNAVWSSPSKNIYVVAFFMGTKGCSVKYDIEGKWWEKQFEISYDDLTPAIKTNVPKMHSVALIDSVTKIEKRDNKTVWYWVFFSLPAHSADNPGPHCRRLGINYSADGKSGMIVHTNCRPGK